MSDIFMTPPRKNVPLQIKVTAEQKEIIKMLAQVRHMSMSEYVLYLVERDYSKNKGVIENGKV